MNVTADQLYAARYAEELRFPQELPLKPGGTTLRLRARNLTLHPALPPTPVWCYTATTPGGQELINPTLRAESGQAASVRFVNQLTDGSLPVVASRTALTTQDPAVIVANFPGASCTAPGYTTSLGAWHGGNDYTPIIALPAVTVAHLHGGLTEARSDGWTENLLQAGESTTHTYGNDQASAMLWYHDHALHVTRLNVYAGLAGFYVVRDADDRQLINSLALHPTTFTASASRRPERELPLLVQDCNLDVDSAGNLAGTLVHKVDSGDGPMEFFGPFTMVNKQIWPKATVRRRQYRLRWLNGSNARTYRLRLIADVGGPAPRVVPWADVATVIGTDGGLRGTPIPADDALLLAPAERLDLIVDFAASALNGVSTLTVVNTAEAPFGTGVVEVTDDAPAAVASPGWDARVPYPGVMRFDLSGPKRAARPMPTPTTSFRRLVHGVAGPNEIQIPGHVGGGPHVHRLIALVEEELVPGDAPTLTLRELVPFDGTVAGSYSSDAAGAVTYRGERLIQVTEPGKAAMVYRTAARLFTDPTSIVASIGDVEVWKVLNLTADTHPFHVHLVQMQVIGRARPAGPIGVDAATWPVPDTTTVPSTGTAPAPVAVVLSTAEPATPADACWKDVIRVAPDEMVAIAVPFGTVDPVGNVVLPRTFAGRYMYHCHLLEHEDHDMMRGFLVLPQALAAMVGTHHH